MEPNQTNPSVIQQTQAPVSEPPKPHRLIYFLAAILLAVLIGGGIYYWQHKKVNDLSTKLGSLSSQLAAQKAKTSPTATTSDPDLTKSTDLVKTFYAAYIKNSSPDLVKQYGTSNLVFYNQYYQHGFNPIVCAQSTPDSIQVAGNKSSDGVANLTVTEVYAGSPTKSTLSVNVVNQGGLKIDSLTCGGSLGNLPNTSAPSN